MNPSHSDLDYFYENWIISNSERQDTVDLVGLMLRPSMRASLENPAHRHLFFNKAFWIALAGVMADALSDWPEEVAALRVTYGVIKEFGNGMAETAKPISGMVEQNARI